MIIDGTTQSGILVGARSHDRREFLQLRRGLFIRAGNSTVRGLAIGRFGGPGILLETNGGNTITGCYIGIQPAGSSLPNARGIAVLCNNNTIGGTTTATRNVIAWNAGGGITVTSASGNVDSRELHRSRGRGTTAAGNHSGIMLENASDTTIGGTASGARNVIGANSLGEHHRTRRRLYRHVVEGNFIGTDASGVVRFCESGLEIDEYANGTTIGGTAAGASNTIAFCYLPGIAVPSGTRATIRGNSMFGDGIPIDLGSDGPSPNDSGDTDGGPNGLQNFPVIAARRSAAARFQSRERSTAFRMLHTRSTSIQRGAALSSRTPLRATTSARLR